MKRIAVAVMLAACPVFLLSPIPGRADDVVSDDIYVVRPGDTLSGIAGSKLGDSKRWQEILEANPQITDAELIYPGDTLVLPLQVQDKAGEELAVDTEGEEITVEHSPPPSVEPAPLPVADETASDVSEPVEPLLPVERVLPPPTISHNIYKAAGYIAEDLPESSIVSSLDDKTSLVNGDEVMISVSAEEGDSYTVVRPIKKVFHPQSGQFLGWAIKIIGWAEVNCTGKKASRAILKSTVDTVNVGDLIVPVDPNDVLWENIRGPRQSTFCLKKEETGYIVAVQENMISIVEGDIVFLDRGSEEGVRQGDQLVVYRGVEPEGIQVIGQVQVLKVGRRTSTALVTYSMQEMAVNDLVQIWEPPVIEEVSGG